MHVKRTFPVSLSEVPYLLFFGMWSHMNRKPRWHRKRPGTSFKSTFILFLSCMNQHVLCHRLPIHQQTPTNRTRQRGGAMIGEMNIMISFGFKRFPADFANNFNRFEMDNSFMDSKLPGIRTSFGTTFEIAHKGLDIQMNVHMVLQPRLPKGLSTEFAGVFLLRCPRMDSFVVFPETKKIGKDLPAIGLLTFVLLISCEYLNIFKTILKTNHVILPWSLLKWLYNCFLVYASPHRSHGIKFSCFTSILTAFSWAVFLCADRLPGDVNFRSQPSTSQRNGNILRWVFIWYLKSYPSKNLRQISHW